MDLDPSSLRPSDAYRWMTCLVVPRPIAWVSTLDGAGRPNLAPFSFFGGVSSTPPIVLLSVAPRREGRKDTAANLIETGEAVVHVCHRPLAEAMVATSAEVAPGVDEFLLAGLGKEASHVVKPWRVRGAAIALEARLERHLTVGDAPNDVFLLRVVHIHVDDAFLVGGFPDPARLAAVGRLGGSLYCDTALPFPLERPT